MRPISLLTRLSAAANTCLRCKGCSTVPGKACASLCPLRAHRTAVLPCQSTLLAAHIAQPLAQRLEVIEPDIIDFGMVSAQDDLVLLVAENAALEFAGYGHGEIPIPVRWRL
jgi:hypothetical protein